MKSTIGLMLAVICCNLFYAAFSMHKVITPAPGVVQTTARFATNGMDKIKDSSLVSEVHMNIVASDGVKLRATYYTPGQPGPGILLLHQCNMDRRSWKMLATALAQRGIHVLTFDYRGYGETPRTGSGESLATDIDDALEMLISQPGVNKSKIGAGGASCGVNNAIELAKRNDTIKTLLLLSGPTSEEGLKFLREHPGLAIFGAASSEEDFAVKAISQMVAASTNPASMMKTLHNAGHGAPMFTADAALLRSLTDWMVKVLR